MGVIPLELDPCRVYGAAAVRAWSRELRRFIMSGGGGGGGGASPSATRGESRGKSMGDAQTFTEDGVK